MGDRVLVSMATYNEHGNLASLIQEIRSIAPDADVLITDDNSPDGTGRLADELAKADPKIHVIHRPGKLGLGTAIVDAMRFAIERNYDLFVNMDADFSHMPSYLPAVIEGMKNNDVMIGSRYVPGGGSVNWPLSRRLMSRSVNLLVRILMGIPANDTSGGYRCYRVAKLREINFDRLISHGYSFQQEMLFRCRRVGCKIGETPITFEKRRAGASKVNPYEAIRSLSLIVFVGMRYRLGLDRN